MTKPTSRLAIRRRFLILASGTGLLLLVLIAGTTLALAHRNAPASSSPLTQTAQAGPYTLAWSLSPNPPPAFQFAHLIMRVTDTSTGQPVTDAGVQFRGVMERMEMSMGPLYANPQSDGSYTIDIRFSMNGFWQVQVTVTRPNAAPASAQIEITSTAPPQ